MALWGANQYAMITKEATYGTFDNTATVKTWLEIQDDNGVTRDREPQRQIKRAATGNLRRRLLSRRSKISGSFKTILFSDQAAVILPLALTPTTIAGRINLPSFTLDYFDGVQFNRTLGCRFDKASLTSGNQSDWVEASLSWIGGKEDTTPPTMTEPAITAYPVGAPYAFQDSAGLCKLYSGTSAVVVGYKSLSLTITNMLDPQYDEFAFYNSCDYCGRDVDAEIVIAKVNATLKGYFEAQTNVNAYFKFAQTLPAASMILDMGGSCSISDLKTDHSLNKSQYQTVKLQSFQDMTTGVDLVATVAYTP